MVAELEKHFQLRGLRSYSGGTLAFEFSDPATYRLPAQKKEKFAYEVAEFLAPRLRALPPLADDEIDEFQIVFSNRENEDALSKYYKFGLTDKGFEARPPEE